MCTDNTLKIKQVHSDSQQSWKCTQRLDVSHPAEKAPNASLHTGDPLWHSQQDFYGFANVQEYLCGEVNATD